MLIVPIVEGLDWRRPRPATVALILINCLIFFLYQTGDAAREQRVVEAYFASSLASLELPAYTARLSETHPRLASEIDKADPRSLLAHMEGDEAVIRP